MLVFTMNFHKSHYQRYHQNDGGSWQSHTHSPADTELAAPPPHTAAMQPPVKSCAQRPGAGLRAVSQRCHPGGLLQGEG